MLQVAVTLMSPTPTQIPLKQVVPGAHAQFVAEGVTLMVAVFEIVAVGVADIGAETEMVGETDGDTAEADAEAEFFEPFPFPEDSGLPGLGVSDFEDPGKVKRSVVSSSIAKESPMSSSTSHPEGSDSVRLVDSSSSLARVELLNNSAKATIIKAVLAPTLVVLNTKTKKSNNAAQRVLKGVANVVEDSSS